MQTDETVWMAASSKCSQWSARLLFAIARVT